MRATGINRDRHAGHCRLPSSTVLTCGSRQMHVTNEILLFLVLASLCGPQWPDVFCNAQAAFNFDAQILSAFAQKINTNPNSSGKNPCLWKGVSCTNGNRVQALNLSSAQLTGTISPAITGFSRLAYLNLSHNSLTGTIPSGLPLASELKILDLSTNFLTGSIPAICNRDSSKLTELYLNDNQLSGALGTSLSSCQSLLVLSLANNQLTDPDILVSLAKLPALQYLSLSGNTIGSTIPPTVKLWKNLKWLMLDDCILSGSIPAEIGFLTKLESLNVKNNQISGGIPEALFKCLGLKEVFLNGNIFIGSIPSIIESLSVLQTFYAYDNALTGDIPEGIFSLVGLRDLNIRSNRLSGRISSKIGGQKSLYSLDLSHNCIVGEIPEEITSCESLSWIDLSNNELSDTIPAGIGNLTSLVYLNLSHNQLTGEIPYSVADLPNIQLFDVSDNQLVGPVPDTEVFQQLGVSSFISNKGLCGWITNQSRQACLVSLNQRYLFGHVSLHIAIAVIVAVFLLISVGAWQCIIRWSPFGSEITSSNVQKMTFTVKELQNATEGFDQKNFVGQGTHYLVYRGTLSGNKTVAVKRLMQEFVEEFQQTFTIDWMTLSRVKHPNIVDVFGWCPSTELLAAVTAFMPNSTLEQHLYGDKGATTLSLERRLKIAEGIANGLAYLHRDWQAHPMLRCELRSSTILLGKQFQPHLLKVRVAKSKYASVQGQVTLMDAYTAPECIAGSMVTAKAEVYSYGMVMLELLTRKKPAECLMMWGPRIDEALRQPFPAWDMVDPVLKTQDMQEKVLRLMEVAIACIDATPECRPSMKLVLQTLKGDMPTKQNFTERIFASQRGDETSVHPTAPNREGFYMQLNPLFSIHNQQPVEYVSNIENEL